MTIKVNAPGKRRKELAQTLAKLVGAEVLYEGAPTFAYKVDTAIIDRNGVVVFTGKTTDNAVERVARYLKNDGFEAETVDDKPVASDTKVEISIVDTDIDETTISNVKAIIDSKADLIKKALSVDDLSVINHSDRISFPWFKEGIASDELKAYTAFLNALCNMAKTLKRVNKSDTVVTNEKYAFRCFLLRLGFIGDEYKTERKVLLKNLSGSAAFRNEKKTEVA